MPERTKFTTIDDYISGFPEETQDLLWQIVETIQSEAPLAEEMISYGMPCFKLGPKSKIWIAGYKSHIGMYPVHDMDLSEEELSLYLGKGTKSALHFALDKPLPLDFIARIVQNKMKKKAG